MNDPLTIVTAILAGLTLLATLYFGWESMRNQVKQLRLQREQAEMRPALEVRNPLIWAEGHLGPGGATVRVEVVNTGGMRAHEVLGYASLDGCFLEPHPLGLGTIFRQPVLSPTPPTAPPVWEMNVRVVSAGRTKISYCFTWDEGATPQREFELQVPQSLLPP